jgi:hypothetical protein
MALGSSLCLLLQVTSGEMLLGKIGEECVTTRGRRGGTAVMKAWCFWVNT